MAARLACVLGAIFVVACGDGGGGGPTAPPGPSPVFGVNFRESYALVRSCRSPGEHSGMNAFTVWVNTAGNSAFTAIWATPPSVTEMTDGAVVVKEIYSGTDCDPKTVDHWVAMEKKKGFDSTHGDWHWQEVRADRSLASDGATDSCIQCHAGGEGQSCAGYGQAAGRDYLCTAP